RRVLFRSEKSYPYGIGELNNIINYLQLKYMKKNLIVAVYRTTICAFDSDDDRLQNLEQVTTLIKKGKSHISENGHKATIWEDAAGAQYEVFRDRSCKTLTK